MDKDFFKKNFKNLFSPTEEELEDAKMELFPCSRTIYINENEEAFFPGVIKLSFDD